MSGKTGSWPNCWPRQAIERALHTKSASAAGLHSFSSGQSIGRVGGLLAGLRGPTLALALGCALTACSSTPADRTGAAPGNAPKTGGDLVVSMRAEPRSLSWYSQHDAGTQLISLLTQARLVRVNAATQELEPWLADSWARTDDGLRYTLKLHPQATFSDGVPFTSDDVVFSVNAAYDKASALADTLSIAGGRLQAAAIDPLTVAITFPAPFGPGLRLLDNLPILPRHKLEGAVRDGSFGSAWGLSTPPAELAGLGPFALSEYRPGERLVFARNPHYFRKDANGAPLPYLDRVVVEIVPDQDAQILRLQGGQSDMSSTEIRSEDFAPLKRAADQGSLQLLDLGPSTDLAALWVNLRPNAFARDSRRAWIQRDELRQAISLAVDRGVFVDTVYLGAAVPAFGPVTPANKLWYSADVPQTPHDPARAKELLAAIGIADRNGDGLLDDPGGATAHITLLTQKGQTSLEKGAAVVRDELKKIGLVVDVVALEGNALIKTFLSGESYDAVYFFLAASDTDPAMNGDFWLSSGGAHIWNPGQKSPATDWERQIDELMARQARTIDDAERRRVFTDVQKIFAAHLPMVHFAAPRVFVATSSRVTNLSPAVSRPQLLWSADTIAVKH